MTRVAVALLATWTVGLTLLWLLAQISDNAEGRRGRLRHPKPVAISQPIDVGPKIVRTIRVDPCEVALTFAEQWKCRTQQ